MGTVESPCDRGRRHPEGLGSAMGLAGTADFYGVVIMVGDATAARHL